MKISGKIQTSAGQERPSSGEARRLSVIYHGASKDKNINPNRRKCPEDPKYRERNEDDLVVIPLFREYWF